MVVYLSDLYRLTSSTLQKGSQEKKMLASSIGIVLLFLAPSSIAQQQDSLPVQLPQVDIEGRNDGTCPSD